MLSAYFFNDGEILVPSDVWEMGAEGTGRAPTIKRDKTDRATSKYVIPSGTKCSRVKFPRRNGGNVADFQATKGVRCACEQSPRKRPCEMGAEVLELCKGSCRGIANMGAADASRRIAY